MLLAGLLTALTALWPGAASDPVWQLEACRREIRISGPWAEVREARTYLAPTATPDGETRPLPSGAAVRLRVDGETREVPSGAALNLPPSRPGDRIAVEVTHRHRLRLAGAGWHLELPAVLDRPTAFAPERFETTVIAIMPLPIRGMTSRSHGVDLKAGPGGRVEARIVARDARQWGTPVTLEIGTGAATGAIEAGVLDLGQGRVLLQVQPPSVLPVTGRVPLELRVLLEASGLQTADRLLKTLFWSLGQEDRIAVAVACDPPRQLPSGPPTGRRFQELQGLLRESRGLPAAPLRGALAPLLEAPRRPGWSPALVVVSDGRGSDLPEVASRLRSLGSGWDVAVVGTGQADALGLALLAGRPLTLSTERPEAVAGHFLDLRRVPVVEDLTVDGPGVTWLHGSRTAWMDRGALGLLRLEGRPQGTLRIQGRIGDSVWSRTLAPGREALVKPLERDLLDLEGIAVGRPEGASAPARTAGVPHDHRGGNAHLQAPYLCGVQAEQEGLPPSELWSRVEAVLLEPALRRRLRQTQREDFTVSFTVGADGRVSSVGVAPKLAAPAVEQSLRRALAGLRLEGWTASGTTRVTVPLHTH